jgi:multimeric flavodoxin WrbA
MKATILLATLKQTGLSNTATLCEFLAERMQRAAITCETIKLVDHNIPPGTYSNMGPGDEWPRILDKILASDILIFATPVWWSNQSSLMQRVIERLDELHDHILEGKPSGLEGKVAAATCAISLSRLVCSSHPMRRSQCSGSVRQRTKSRRATNCCGNTKPITPAPPTA